ncbi:MAG TPA: hypothetical protein VKV37_09245 [Ktedonobacteraceae bacterium]|nr:hypothetical protein [Ktedonobacteraceae bacterium]
MTKKGVQRMLVLVLVFILAVEAAGSTFLWLRLGKLKNDIVNASNLIRRSDALAVKLLDIENSLRRILEIIHTVQSLQFQIRDKIQEE